VHPAPSQFAIVGWTSPITGTVQIAGGLTSLDGSCGVGTSWSIDQGTTMLASGTNGRGGSTSFPSLSATVKAGDSLYFIVGPAPSGSIECDTTQVQATITGAAGSTTTTTTTTNNTGPGNRPRR
jgi:hypothetical protein